MSTSKQHFINTAAIPAVRFSEILVATDFSDLSQNAIELSKSVARRFNSEILAVHVTEPLNPINVPEGQWFYSDDEVVTAENIMEGLRQSLKADGVKVRVSCPVGNIAHEIEKTAKESKADLVIVGTHAWTGAKRWVLGSVAETLARKLNIPLLLVGPYTRKQRPGEAWHTQLILCASPMDSEGKDVALYTSALARELKSGWQMACDYLSRDSECMDWETFYKDLENEMASAGHGEDRLQTVLLSKPYPQQLTELAGIRGADLIVIGHSHQILDWSMIRSGTLPHLLATARCPVLILPTHRRDGV